LAEKIGGAGRTCFSHPAALKLNMLSAISEAAEKETFFSQF
jgi:hypothetical protein